MPKVNDMFPSKYLKADDLPHAVAVAVARVESEIMDEQTNEHKWVLYFVGKTKGLVLNRTNANMLAHLFGDDTDSWTNQKINLVAEAVTYMGKITQGIRVKPAQAPAPPAAAVAAPTPQAPPSAASSHPPTSGDAEIPF